jgi:hypothetical protein
MAAGTSHMHQHLSLPNLAITRTYPYPFLPRTTATLCRLPSHAHASTTCGSCCSDAKAARLYTGLRVDGSHNRAVREPRWLADYVEKLDRVHILDSRNGPRTTPISPYTPMFAPLALVLDTARQPSFHLHCGRLHLLSSSSKRWRVSLVQFPGSFKLWKSYLQMRMSFVLGKLAVKKRAGGQKKFPDMKDVLEKQRRIWSSGRTDWMTFVGWDEWKSLIATFERALICGCQRYVDQTENRLLAHSIFFKQLPCLWLMYLSIFSHPQCPAGIAFTHACRTYDRALHTLPPSLHSRIWVRYLPWTEVKGGLTAVNVYRRYLSVELSVTEHNTAILLSLVSFTPRPLEAAKPFLSLARKAACGEYTSPEGKGLYQLPGDWLDVVERFSDEVGLDIDETVTSESNNEYSRAEAEAADAAKIVPELVSVSGPSAVCSYDWLDH